MCTYIYIYTLIKIKMNYCFGGVLLFRSTWACNHFARTPCWMFFESRETWKVYGGNDAGKTYGIRSLRLHWNSSDVIYKYRNI